MRNGNSLSSTSTYTVPYVLILPMRNGNLFFFSKSKTKDIVLILPMRNGNFPLLLFLSFISPPFLSYLWGMETLLFTTLLSNVIGSYPTYEEWKRSSKSSRFWFCKYVLILPMRNGNNLKLIAHVNVNPFLSYLWGMETYS